jgi:hypothetical protein
MVTHPHPYQPLPTAVCCPLTLHTHPAPPPPPPSRALRAAPQRIRLEAAEAVLGLQVALVAYRR